MSLYNIPLLNGKKTLIAGYGLILVGVGGLLTAVGDCMQTLDVQACYAQISEAYNAMLAALMGLGFIGVGHKAEKSTPSV
jgi:hypothetical protein